jgi:hypothetical protein
LRGPGGGHGDRPPRGRRGAEAGAAARSRFRAALIPCRTIGEEIAEYDGCIIEPLRRVYIGVIQGLEAKEPTTLEAKKPITLTGWISGCSVHVVVNSSIWVRLWDFAIFFRMVSLFGCCFCRLVPVCGFVWDVLCCSLLLAAGFLRLGCEGVLWRIARHLLMSAGGLH